MQVLRILRCLSRSLSTTTAFSHFGVAAKNPTFRVFAYLQYLRLSPWRAGSNAAAALKLSKYKPTISTLS
jgi:hypothetical protein